MRITQAMVFEVQRLLTQEKLSHRRVAKLVGISRSTVGKIATGRRRAWPDRPASDDSYSIRPSGPVARCPGCGGRVYLPCRLCHVRMLKALDRSGGSLARRSIIPAGLRRAS
ncbi:MAG TPA: hypothetical protein VHZ24_22950 [Pirellulales bacterium]|jgi:hypothetical protein|nr:hypothetical protein [Pirellulales bacterium]